MKILKIILGVLFAVWAILMVPGCVKSLMKATTVAELAIDLATSLLGLCIIGMFSYWSFQSAFKKK
jgi:hypothetical protein